MLPGARRDIAGERTPADIDVVVEADLPDHPRRIVDAKRQAVMVAQLRIASPGPDGSPLNTAPNAVILSDSAALIRMPGTAIGGAGPPAGRL